MLPNVFEAVTKPSCFAHFQDGAESLEPAAQNHILTSKSAPRPPVFYTFEFEMCFAPQCRALFSNIAIPKMWCVLCAFWLGNVLGATTAYTFWTSQFLKVFRSWGVLRILNFEMFFPPQRRALFQRLIFQKCSGAGVFCMFLLRNVFRATTACNFSSLVWLASLLFDPPEPQIIGKT